MSGTSELKTQYGTIIGTTELDPEMTKKHRQAMIDKINSGAEGDGFVLIHIEKGQTHITSVDTSRTDLAKAAMHLASSAREVITALGEEERRTNMNREKWHE